MWHVSEYWQRIGRIAVLLAAVLALAGPAGAQSSNGAIAGTIMDAQGGVLPGVSLTLRNAETGTTRETVTGGDGRYRFAALPPSTYELKAELQGFAPLEVKELILTLGLELVRDLSMKLQTLQEAVTVTAESPVVSTTKSEVSDVVTQRQIDTMPIQARQALTLALLLPGTSMDANRPRKVNATVGGGGTFYASTFLIDGTMNQEVKAGEPRQDMPQGAIREFKVNLSQFTAEAGGGTGGLVTIVTKSGTNLFSGEAFEYFRDKALNTMNKFEQLNHDTKGTPKPAFRRNQFGTSLGGPIIRDRVHVFGAVDWTNIDQFINVNTGKPQFYGSLEGSFKNPSWRHLMFARGDAQINSAQNLFVRWAWEHDHVGCETCGGINSAFSGTGVEQNRASVVAGHTWVLSPTHLNEFRFQYGPFVFLTGPPGRPTPYPNVVGDYSDRTPYRTFTYTFPSLVWGTNGSSVIGETIYEWRDEFLINAGSHAWKMGVGVLDIPTPEDAIGNIGSWRFSTDQPFDPSGAFVLGQPFDPTRSATIMALKSPNQFTASFPPQIRNSDQWWYQAYVQDEWKPRSNVTINAGLRWDAQVGVFNERFDFSVLPPKILSANGGFIDQATRGDHNNFQPRLGIAWDVTGDGRTVARGGYGLYYQTIWSSASVGERVNLLQTSITITNPTYPDPYGGKDPASFASTAPPNITTQANNLRNAHANVINGGISRELAHNLAIHIDGTYTRTRGMPESVNINTPLQGATPGVAATPTVRPFPAWGQVNQFQSRGEQTYKALFVRFEKRYSNRYQYLVSYTLAKNDDNLTLSGTGTSPGLVDLYHPENDFGPSNIDRRHALVVSGAFLAPGGVTLGAVYTFRTTMPFNAQAGKDLNVDGSQSDYVPGTTRNQGNRNLNLALVNAWRALPANGSLPPISASQLDSNRYSSLDVRASKSFAIGGNRKVEAIAQIFNVLGTDNLLPPATGGAWVTNSLSDSFGRLLTANNRQQGELAVRLTW